MLTGLSVCVSLSTRVYCHFNWHPRPFFLILWHTALQCIGKLASDSAARKEEPNERHKISLQPTNSCLSIALTLSLFVCLFDNDQTRKCFIAVCTTTTTVRASIILNKSKTIADENWIRKWWGPSSLTFFWSRTKLQVLWVVANHFQSVSTFCNLCLFGTEFFY